MGPGGSGREERAGEGRRMDGNDQSMVYADIEITMVNMINFYM